jgi:very-short-patch-repair endonuclease
VITIENERKHNRELVPMARTLRKNMTREERHLWYDFLRDYPIKFTRQKVMGKFIVDFYCPTVKLAIELDGSQHFEKTAIKKDAERTAYLEKFGVVVIRFTNDDVTRHFESVCDYIDYCVNRRMVRTT